MDILSSLDNMRILVAPDGPRYVSYVVHRDEVDTFLARFNDQRTIWKVLDFEGSLCAWSAK